MQQTKLTDYSVNCFTQMRKIKVLNMSIQLVVVSGERLNSGVHISHMKWKEFVQAKREINNTSYILGTV